MLCFLPLSIDTFVFFSVYCLLHFLRNMHTGDNDTLFSRPTPNRPMIYELYASNRFAGVSTKHPAHMYLQQVRALGKSDVRM